MKEHSNIVFFSRLIILFRVAFTRRLPHDTTQRPTDLPTDQQRWLRILPTALNVTFFFFFIRSSPESWYTSPLHTHDEGRTSCSFLST